MPTTHNRTCHICEANCGVVITTEGREILSIKGDPANALSRGHICPKATALEDLQNDPDRLRAPQNRGCRCIITAHGSKEQLNGSNS